MNNNGLLEVSVEPGSRINLILKSIRRWWSAVTQPGTGGLIRHGDWCCRYKDGERTYWMSHGDAANLREAFGGRLEWRGDTETKLKEENV